MGSGTDNIEDHIEEMKQERERKMAQPVQTVPLEPQIKVELVDACCTDLATVNAARVSFHKESKDVSSDDERLIKYLAKHKHMTPFRHNFIKIRVKAPIFLAAQLKKHQAGLSWNEVSRRYVDTPPEFYVPFVWRKRPDGSVKQGSVGVIDNLEATNWHYSRFLSSVVDTYHGLLANDVAPEMARMVLPQSMMTEWVWSGNLLAFAHVYRERIASGAQLEAQLFAQELDKIIRPLAPISWGALKIV